MQIYKLVKGSTTYGQMGLKMLKGKLEFKNLLYRGTSLHVSVAWLYVVFDALVFL